MKLARQLTVQLIPLLPIGIGCLVLTMQQADIPYGLYRQLKAFRNASQLRDGSSGGDTLERSDRLIAYRYPTA